MRRGISRFRRSATSLGDLPPRLVEDLVELRLHERVTLAGAFRQARWIQNREFTVLIADETRSLQNTGRSR